jgi:hypothetical protein
MREHITDQGQLEGDARPDENIQQVIQVIVEGGPGDQQAAESQFIIRKEAEGKRGKQKISKSNAQEEKKGHKKNGSPGAPDLFWRQGRLYKSPKLPEYVWEGNDKPANKGDGNTGYELGTKGRCLKLHVSGWEAKRIPDMQEMTEFAEYHHRKKILAQGSHDDLFKDPVDLEETNDRNDYDCQYGPHNMPSQRLQVFNKGHFCLPRSPFEKT